MKRAILYARVSGDDSKYATSGIESQLADCRNYIKQRDYQNVGEYFETPDKRTSGADWLPEIESILRLAQQGAFDVLVVREIDRLARNRFKQMSVEIDLEAHGVCVEYVIGQYDDTAEGRLLKGLVSEFAEYERQKTRERTRRGILRSVAAKNVTVGGSLAPYGYDLDQVDGRRVLVINEREANIVRNIFELYVNQLYSLHGIGEYLDKHKIPKPAKGNNHKARTIKAKWSTGTISGFLNNETYIGHWYYRKTKRVKQIDGSYRNILRPKDEWILIEVPAILSEPIFKLAQKRRKANKRIKNQNRRHVYAMSGIMTCAHCGNGISGITRYHKDKPYRYYKCNARHLPKRYGFKCENPQAKVSEVDAAIWQWVAEILLSPDKLREAWQNHQAQREEALQPILSMIEANEVRLLELEEEKQRLVKAYAAGVLSLDDVSGEKPRIDKQINDLTEAIQELRADIKPKLPTNQDIETIEEFAQQLQTGADLAYDEPEQQRAIYRLLHTEAKLRYEGGHHWVDVNCTLGETRLSTEYTTPGCSGSALR